MLVISYALPHPIHSLSAYKVPCLFPKGLRATDAVCVVSALLHCIPLFVCSKPLQSCMALPSLTVAAAAPVTYDLDWGIHTRYAAFQSLGGEGRGQGLGSATQATTATPSPLCLPTQAWKEFKALLWELCDESAG